MIKILSLFLIFSFLTFSNFAQEVKEENQPAKVTTTQGTGTFFVTAPQGLNIRSTPSRSGVVIVKMPFQSQVEVLEYSKEEDEYEGHKAKWAKLKFRSQKNKTYTGWAFSHFLAKTKTAK